MTVFARGRLERELRAWRDAGLTPRLWWRDDDARDATPRLERLLALARSAPLTLAVIPDRGLGALAARLSGQANVTVAQHGVDHIDRAAPGTPHSEVEPGLGVEALTGRIAEGRRRMIAAGLPPRAFAPPFNHLDPALVTALSAAGFDTLTAGARPEGWNGPPAFAACEVDILRWRGGPRFKGRGRVLDELRVALAHRRAGALPRDPVGLLTHHLDHDDAAWTFLEWFVAWAGPRFEWVDLSAAAAPR